MELAAVLSPDRCSVAGPAEGEVRTKRDALLRVAALLALDLPLDRDSVHAILAARESLQSTGIGGGVGIPHGVHDAVARQVAAVLVCPQGIDFDAIDHAPVRIIVAILGPRRATGEHLRLLARVSRVLRDDSLRQRLVLARSGLEVHDMLRAEDVREARP